MRDYLLPEPLGESLRGTLVREVALGGKLTRLRRALWCGASTRARQDLERIVLASDSQAHEIAGAAWILGTFHASLGRWSEALENAELIKTVMPRYRALQGRCLLAADALMALERHEEARELLTVALSETPSNAHLLLALANTYAISESGDEKRLGIINAVLAQGGLEPISMRNVGAPLSIDNVEAPSVAPVPEGPLVTVIVPAFKASSTIGFALRSLCEQSWRNLEVIVVDDCSPDDTFQVASEISRRDARVRCLRMSENRGAYAARNLALRSARGELVTVHDADDWSHPRKIELQARQLIEDRRLVANESDWVRAYSHLYFRGTARVSSQWVTPNISSMMVRREELISLGGWNEVRVAADSELRRRLMHMRDRDLFGRVLPGVPLSFALELTSSLTRRSTTHVHTISYGVRRNYHDASRFWLENQPRIVPAIRPGLSFPVPAPIAAKSSRAQLDVVIVMDFLWPSRELRDTWRCIRALASRRKVGIFQVGHYPENLGRKMPSRVFRAAQEGQLYVVSPGEDVDCPAVFVMKPDLFTYKVDLAPRLLADKVSMVARPGTLGGDGAVLDAQRFMAFAEESFELPGEWIASTTAASKKLQGSQLAPLAEGTLEAWVRANR